ncbi:Radical SAM domain-containing protein, partial [Candidatus Magnetomorum sp. HK-1]
MSTIVLINTSYPDKDSNSYTKLSIPLGLLSISSPLISAGFEVILIDPQIEKDYIKKIEIALKEPPLFVGMTVFMGSNILNALNLSKFIKSIDARIPIVWGGPLATSSPEICFNHSPVDYIVMGMGEKEVIKVAQKIEQGKPLNSLANVSYKDNNTIHKKPIYNFCGDIDSLEYPDLTMWKRGIYQLNYIPILTSRGCPRNCSFCYNNTFTGRKKWYGRSMQNVLNEMSFWGNYFNKKSFHFIDDNFLVNTKRACHILKESIARNYQIDQILGHLNDFKPEILNLITGYIHHIGFSIESASYKIQKLLNKIIDLEKAFGILEYFSKNNVQVITTNFMFGLPT